MRKGPKPKSDLELLRGMLMRVCIDPGTGCWLYIGPKTKGGYGIKMSRSRDTMAHRLMYILMVADIPKELEVDHLCRVRHCINPKHMQLVTHAENCHRGNGWSGRHAKQTHCIRGHELPSPKRVGNRIRRRCVICENTRKREKYNAVQ